jgi:hypothetical protein
VVLAPGAHRIQAAGRQAALSSWAGKQKAWIEPLVVRLSTPASTKPGACSCDLPKGFALVLPSVEDKAYWMPSPYWSSGS